MKKENFLLPISIIILGGCIVLSAWIIATRSDKQPPLEQPLTSIQTKALMTSAEAAQYMGILLNDFDVLIYSQVAQKARLQSYDTYRFIPFITIGNTKYFNQTEIDNWIKYNMLNSY